MNPSTPPPDLLPVPADHRVLDAAAAALSAGRYLPVDAPFAETTAGELARAPEPGPRALGYGPPAAWLRSAPTSSEVCWRTVALPPAGRTVVGRFRGGAAVWQAAARLLAARPPALVMLDVGNRVAGDWLLGDADGAERLLVARLEGDADAVARSHRAAWQAVELARGEPYVFEQARGPWAWAPVHAPLAPGDVLVRLSAEPDLLPALLDAVDETGHGAGGRSHVSAGVLYGHLRAAADQAAALRWLSGVTAGLGARMIHVPAAVAPLPEGG